MTPVARHVSREERPRQPRFSVILSEAHQPKADFGDTLPEVGLRPKRFVRGVFRPAQRDRRGGAA